MYRAKCFCTYCTLECVLLPVGIQMPRSRFTLSCSSPTQQAPTPARQHAITSRGALAQSWAEYGSLHCEQQGLL